MSYNKYKRVILFALTSKPSLVYIKALDAKAYQPYTYK